MNLKPSENSLIGSNVFLDGRVVADAVAARIDHLINHVLVKIASSSDGWSKLYRDPDDGRFWELTYCDSDTHGGGPPRLIVMPEKEAASKYKLDGS